MQTRSKAAPLPLRLAAAALGSALWWVAVGGAGPAAAAPRQEAFGRWQPALPGCTRNLAGAQPGACAAVLVDQRSAGVYRVSWAGRGGSGGSGGAALLAFVGVLAPASEPMACRQGICQLERSITLSLSSVSQSEFDPRGVASGLPSAWPVSGTCLLEPGRIRCEARSLTGETWQASAGARP